MAAKQELAQREQALFKQLVRQIDQHEFTKAVRSAESILAINPDHGETISLKGLCFHHLDRKTGPDGSYSLVKLGLSKNIRSCASWHALAMIHKADKNYIEAVKAYKQARKFDPENQTILRDMSSVLVQLRDWESFTDVRQKMLNLKPAVRGHWVAYALGHFMLKNYEMAAAIMDVLVSIMPAGENPGETSEVHLFRAELELLRGCPADAMRILTETKNDVTDVTEWTRLMARALDGTGDKTGAENMYMQLITMKCAERDCIQSIAKLRGVAFDCGDSRGSIAWYPRTDADRSHFAKIIEEISAKFPNCETAKRMILDVTDVSQLPARLEQFCRPYVIKTIPSLFSVLKSLYKFPDRAAVIGEMVKKWESLLLSGGSLDDAAEDGGGASPCHLLWVYALAASHYTRMNDFDLAHKYVEKAIDHSPTMEMLYLMRARILKHQGMLAEAAEAADTARKLDIQDKYLACKAARYYFRAGDIDAGEAIMALYQKPSTENDYYLSFIEMQTLWYEREVGNAFFRKGDFISALQNFLLIEKHQKEHHFELLDFHGYVFRRCNIRSWIDVITHDDNVELNPFFILVAPQIVRSYLKIYEMGAEAAVAAHVQRPPFPPGKSEEEKSRIQKYEEYVLKIDISNPIESAEPYVKLLRANHPKETVTHCLAFDLYHKMQLPLEEMRSLHALHMLNAPAEELMERVGLFKAAWMNQGKAEAEAQLLLPPAITSMVDDLPWLR